MKQITALFPKYENYKDSGVSWLGAVPSKWDIYKLGNCLQSVSEKNHGELQLLSITREQGVIRRDLDSAVNHNFIPDDLSNYKLIKKGQFGINKMKAWQGSYGISNYTGIVSPAYYIFSFKKIINYHFFNIAIRSQQYISSFLAASDGVRIGQWDLSKIRMKAIPFILPSLQEQTAIANFLDQKTAQIDKAIAIKEQQITRLKEYQQIIIQKAVTQGLNPNAPMKDSGIEWIGKIPEHWEVKKLKFILKLQNIKVISSQSNLKYIGMECIDSYTGILNDIYSEAEGQANYFKQNQILFGKLRPYLAKVFKANFEGLCSTEFLVYNCMSIYYADYYAYLLRSSKFIKLIDSSTYGTKMPRASSDFIGNQLILIPSLEEQKQIVNYIETESHKIEQAIALQQAQIEKLKEYKTTLINSAVTGKIKVV